MIKNLLPVLLFMVIVFTSCGPSKTRLSEDISRLEKDLFSSSMMFDKQKADSLFNLYKTYTEKFPEDTVNIMYSFKAANIAMNLEKGDEAVKLLDHIITKYPQHPRAEVSLFFKGFVYENTMKDLEKAKEVYLLFLEKYPQSDFADDARSSLNNLGKTPEEMVAEFQAKQKEDSLKNASVSKIR